MSCPIPIRIVNPRYKKIASLSDNEKITLDSYSDREDFYIDVPCGRCYHCRKSYKTSWNLRLQHHYSYLTEEQKQRSYFITLTFSNEHLPSPTPKKVEISPLIRLFLERVRKRYKHSVTHWLVSEYGDTTQRYHLHGILFDCPFPPWDLEKYWKYGYVSCFRLTPRRITYITTYINKMQRGFFEDPDKHQHVFSSPGIGKSFTEDPLNISYSHQQDTPVPFIYHNARPFAMPRYYRGKMFTEDERENLTESYFHFRSEDVIPPPPYYLGRNKFYDYSLFLSECEKLKKKYKSLYSHSKKQESIIQDYGKQQSKSFVETP